MVYQSHLVSRSFADLISLFKNKKQISNYILSTNFLLKFAQNLHNSKFDAITAIDGFAPQSQSCCKSIFSTCYYRSSNTCIFIGIRFSASVILSKPFASVHVLFIAAVFRLDIFSRPSSDRQPSILDNKSRISSNNIQKFCLLH